MAERLRRLQRQAAREGRGQAMVAAFKRLVHRLQRNAPGVGEPLYRLSVLRMQVRTVVIRPLAVDFAVCEDRPLVFIKSIQLLTE